MGGRDRRSCAHPGDGRARVPGRHVGPARAGGALAARGCARRPRRVRRCRAVSRRSRRAARRRRAVAGRRAGCCAAPTGDRRWRQLDRPGGPRFRRVREGLGFARGLRLPSPGRDRQPRSALRRPSESGRQPQAGGAGQGGGSDRGLRHAAGRHRHRWLHAAGCAVAAAEARAYSCGQRGTGARLPGRIADSRRDCAGCGDAGCPRPRRCHGANGLPARAPSTRRL